MHKKSKYFAFTLVIAYSVLSGCNNKTTDSLEKIDTLNVPMMPSDTMMKPDSVQGPMNGLFDDRTKDVHGDERKINPILKG